MLYVSTRDGNYPPQTVDFARAVMAGTAPDGGLYTPQSWPVLTPERQAQIKDARYAEVAGAVLSPFCLGEQLTERDLAQVIHDVYGAGQTIFRSPEITPIRPLGADMWLMELFHGPSFAFKDIALQFLARLFDHLLAQQKRRVTFLGATSGDTGSAAIMACARMQHARIVILHPAGRVSEIQRRQMTTFDTPQVTNLAVDGTFDDCQALVKTLFADPDIVDDLGLVAVNSINWARIMAQAVYYVQASLRLSTEGQKVDFAVPTGNFGNVFAGYVARAMGAPVGDLIVASNHNDILPRFFSSGEMAVGRVQPSYSPSMDIQVSSNFERYLFDLLGRDGRSVSALMGQFAARGNFALRPADHQRAERDFAAYRVSDEETLATLRAVYDETGTLIDPHTAVGVHAARAHRRVHPSSRPLVALACAHPGKFADTIEKATSRKFPLPDPLAELMSKPERLVPVRRDVSVIKNYLRGLIGVS